MLAILLWFSFFCLLGIWQKGGIGHGGLRIECIRIGGVEIPNHKRVEYSLQYIHGIGRSRSRQILLDLNFDNKITKDLSEEEVITLRKEVGKYMIEGDLVMPLIPLLIQYSAVLFSSVWLLAISMITLISWPMFPWVWKVKVHYAELYISFSFRWSYLALNFYFILMLSSKGIKIPNTAPLFVACFTETFQSCGDWEVEGD